MHGKTDDLNRIRQEDPFSLTQSLSVMWIGNRCRSFKINWNDWCKSPFLRLIAFVLVLFLSSGCLFFWLLSGSGLRFKTGLFRLLSLS